ncbi:hypothetical protein GCM10022225_83830 [Plantactinospora mayteni]|uniref:Uncharacterized protein n=1 Tax=Plantactinospora mayteni TaxID=566021 RepID=A0ABQ4F4I6_9ACTN|nr:hypothetical protein [Plantactinospora mayteni]GIH01828.1 hypothetical protein Pma05_84000 [Plantactinospora mayteni]
MGAKTALLAFTEGDLRPALWGAVRSDPAEVIDLVRELHPGYEVTPIGDGSLGDYSYPPDDTSYATVLAGAELFCVGGSSAISHHSYRPGCFRPERAGGSSCTACIRSPIGCASPYGRTANSSAR